MIVAAGAHAGWIAAGVVMAIAVALWLRLRLVQRALADLERRLALAQMVAGVIDAIFWVRAVADGQVIYVSPGYERWWGRSAQSLLDDGQSYMDAVVAEDRFQVRSSVRAGMAQGQPFEFGYRLRSADGALRHVRAGYYPYCHAGQTITHWVGWARDVTAEQARQDKTARNRRAMRALAVVHAALARAQTRADLHQMVCDGLVAEAGYAMAWLGLVDAEPDRPVRVTAQAGDRNGYLQGPDIRLDDPATSGGPTATALREGRAVASCAIADDPAMAPWQAAARRAGFAASIALPLVHEAQVFGALTLYADDAGAFAIDEATLLEEVATGLAQGIVALEARAELARSRKMELIGQISGELSHDFNNILGIIASHAETGRLAGDAPAMRDKFALIAQAALRGSDITRSLLGVARDPRGNCRRTDINRVVAGMIPLVRAAVGPAIEVKIELWLAPLMVDVDAAGCNNAIVNLAVNAREAMPGGGMLTVRTTIDYARDDAAGRSTWPAALRGADVAIIEMADNGVGMPDAVRERAFEPFFTTREGAGGTGLGLSAVLGFATHHHGTVQIASIPGQGTKVQVILPLAGMAGVADRGDEGSAERTAISALVVEDEPDLAAAMVETLTLAGHRAVACADRAAALALLQDQRFEVMVCDLLLRGGDDGRDLAQAAAEVDPAMRIVMMSGNAARHDPASPWPLLEKPFSADMLLAAISRVPEPVGN